MKRGCFYLCCMSVIMFMGCGDDSGSSGGSKTEDKTDKVECESSEVKCDGACVDLSVRHWSSCGVCSDGYENADGDDSNGCEVGASSNQADACANGKEKCGETCIDLGEMHWTGCGVCASGYEDADGVASNGCESSAGGGECEGGKVKCGETCVDLAGRHWASCGVCVSGYEDSDGDASNGCEREASGSGPEVSGCEDGLTRCSGSCVSLAEMHWTSCGVCETGYDNVDGDFSNGCEAKAVECTGGLVSCGGNCVNLEGLHWSSCGVCASGFADSDGDASNGCEAANLALGECNQDKDCAGLLHVTNASCQGGACRIDACDDGFADCDKNVANGCEVNGKQDFYHCGAKGLCSTDAEKGVRCKLGDQCDAGACVPVPEIIGCSDGTREGFIDLMRFNNLAACGGAWTVPGIHHNVPACGRKSGNTGTNKEGKGCNLEDLCAEGWHVCLGRGDVMTRSDYGCDGILDGTNQNEPALFITRTSSTGNLNCDPDTVGVPLNMNDIFGCGNFGCYATGKDCDPLKLSGHNLCSALRNTCGCKRQSNGTVSCSSSSSGNACYGGGIGHSIDYFAALNNKTYTPAWDCGNDSSGYQEARDIVKSQADQQGGVMCCKDQCQADADCGVGLICRYHVCVECIRKSDGTYEGCPSGKQCTQQHTCK